MSGIGISGCFGTGTSYPVDDIEEAAAAVDEIVESAPQYSSDNDSDNDLAQLVGLYARRVRLLTWIVIAIVIVMVLNEVK